MNLYFLMSLLFVVLAALAAADAALTGGTLLPYFFGLRWLRVHFVTLGALTEAVFGVLPIVVALHSNLPRPKFRWDIWLSLNVGILTLLVAIPSINQALILAGGTLVFVAATLLLVQISRMRSAQGVPELVPAPQGGYRGRMFYIGALAYLLLGVFVGTGLWLGWGSWLQIVAPLEVHIHANNWGFVALIFAGLIADFYPGFAGRPLAWPRSLTPVFWLMVFGALGLVLGPWFSSLYFTVPGLLLHLTGTLWLLANVIAPIRGDRAAWTPGMWHLVFSYVWILAPVLAAPLVILEVPGFGGGAVEGSAPQALIYGWVLQFLFAMLPFLFRRAFLPDTPAHLGGSWFTFGAINLGAFFLWASIFAPAFQPLLSGIAYSLWSVALLLIAVELWRIARTGLAGLEGPQTVSEAS